MLTSNQENFSPKNTNKEITDDLEKILIQFNHSNQIHHYYMNILPPFLFLYNKQLNLSLIPLQRLFKKDSGEVKIENSLYYYVTYNSMISRLSFSIYFDEKEKVIELENEINIKFYEKVIFDDYEILYNKKIGNGNFSNVYLCKSLTDEKIYCVKVINRDLLHGIHSSSLNKEIVNHEIDIAKNILMKSHNKYIINCKGVYESLNEVYIIYKYIKNGNLITFLKNKIREKPEDKLKLIDTILYQLIKAVTYVQKLGVSHRDIKPDNVLVDVKKNGKFKIQLIDYGLSKCISYSEEMNLNVGSLVFTAPEILLNYKYRMNIDTWSCGIMAYFLLFDNLPFNINSSEDEPDLVKQKIIQSKFKFPYVNNEKNKLDEKIRKFIELALEKDKNIRPFMKDIIYD
jgi:serine/threonine/tyrosine protein kinase RAD53